MKINFRALFDASPNPYVLLSPDLAIVECNAAYARVTGRDRQELLGLNIFDAFPGAPGPDEPPQVAQLRASLERAVRTRVPDTLALIHYPISRITPDGVVFDDRYWSATHTPLLDEAGQVAFVLQHTVDVTELHQLRLSTLGMTTPSSDADRDAQAEMGVLNRARQVQQVNELLHAERLHLRRLFQQAPGFIAVLSGQKHVFELVNRAYADLVGQRDVVGLPVAEALPEVRTQGFVDLLDQVYQSGQAFVGSQVRILLQQKPDEPPQERYLDFVYQPIMGADGQVSGIFVQGSDVTDRQRAEARQQLLLDELNHRVKNTLATVQAIASHTSRGAESPEAFRRDFQARLKALAQTHDALTRRSWESAELRELLEQELRPHGASRVSLAGPSVQLPPRDALSLGMVFHELATNAAKHGALSVPQGRVDVAWEIVPAADGRTSSLRLAWRESGGPTVQPRTRRGFGSILIENSVRSELGGRVTLHLPPGGVACDIEVPLAVSAAS